MRHSIGKKITSGFLLIILLMGALAYFSLRAGEQHLREAIAKESVTLAEVLLKRINRQIFSFIPELRLHISHGMLLKNTLAESNAEFKKFPILQELISTRDQEWTATDEITSFKLGLIHNPLSALLREEFFDFFTRQYGYQIFSEVFVTNRYGANIAQTGPTSNYRQDDEVWWQRAREHGFFVSRAEFDQSSNTFGVSIAVRVEDDQGNFLGVLKAVVLASGIIRQAEIGEQRFATTRIRLVTDDGRLVYSSRPFRFLEDITGEDFFQHITGEQGYFTGKIGNRERLYAYSRAGSSGSFERLNWFIVVGHDLEEIMAPASLLTRRVLFAAALFMGIGLAIALLTSHSITRPLARLVDDAEIIGQGDMEHRVAVTGVNEIGQLAAAFNRMTASLKRTTASRDELEREIAGRKITEEKLRRAEEMLLEKNSELEQVVYTTSHDLRSPLVNVQGFSSELEKAIESLAAELRETELDPGQQAILARYLDQDIPESLHFIRTGISKMDTLLAGLLHLSRLGRVVIEPHEIDMNELIGELVASVDFQAKEAGVEIEVGDLPPCLGDRAQISQVFSNLIDNSLKYLDPDRPGRIKISGKSENNWANYLVEDNGIGVAAEHQHKVFQLFHRLDPNRTKGEGLGLNIVTKIVEKHHGTVTMESVAGKGCRIGVRLPGTKQDKKRDKGGAGSDD